MTHLLHVIKVFLLLSPSSSDLRCIFLRRMKNLRAQQLIVGTFYSLAPLLQSGVFVQRSVVITGGDQVGHNLPWAWAPPGGQMELVLA